MPNQSDSRDDDQEARKARAAAIRRQIEKLRRGENEPPANPREFVDRSTNPPEDLDKREK